MTLTIQKYMYLYFTSEVFPNFVIYCYTLEYSGKVACYSFIWFWKSTINNCACCTCMLKWWKGQIKWLCPTFIPTSHKPYIYALLKSHPMRSSAMKVCLSLRNCICHHGCVTIFLHVHTFRIVVVLVDRACGGVEILFVFIMFRVNLVMFVNLRRKCVARDIK